MSVNVNYFDMLPREIMLVIYSFIPEHWPVMSKLNRRWRQLLKDKYDADYDYVQALLPLGYKYKRGVLDISVIREDARECSCPLLLHSDYTWKYDNERCLDGLFETYQNLMENANIFNLDYEEMESVFIHILSRCVSRSVEVTNYIVMTDNIRAIEHADALGFVFNETTIASTSNLEVVKILRIFGCSWPWNMLENILKTKFYTIDNSGKSTSSWFDIFEYAIKNGCEITDSAAKFAIAIDALIELKLMCEFGYVFSDELLLDYENAHHIRHWMQKYAAD